MGRAYVPDEVVLRLEQIAQGRGLTHCQDLAVRWRKKAVRSGTKGRKEGIQGRKKGKRDQEMREVMMVGREE
jgi:hypothetical protein